MASAGIGAKAPVPMVSIWLRWSPARPFTQLGGIDSIKDDHALSKSIEFTQMIILIDLTLLIVVWIPSFDGKTLGGGSADNVDKNSTSW